MTTPEDLLIQDIETFTQEWIDTIKHFRCMADKALGDGSYPADELSNDTAKLMSLWARDAARAVQVSIRLMTLAANRTPPP